MKFVHAADLHLDSPLLGLARYPGAPVEQIRGATRRAMQNLVDLCIEEEAQLLLLAGDLFDGDWKDFTSGLFFVLQMQRLRKAGIQVVIVRGNHDAASQVTKHLTLPDNVRELPSAAPDTFCFEALGVCVHGQSYARRAEVEDLSGRYPPARAGYLNIGLLHTSASGRPGHENYAPCRLDTLLSKGYDYWALGHVHQREVLSESPWVIFPGNLQGRHMRERGPKGATLVEVASGKITRVEHRSLDVVRFERCEVQVGAELADMDAVLDAVDQQLLSLLTSAESRLLVVRVVLSGVTALHGLLWREQQRFENEVRARSFDYAQLWIESVRLCTAPVADAARLGQRLDAIGQVFGALQRYRDNVEAQTELAPLFADLSAKLPAEMRLNGGEGEGSSLDEALSDVAQLLLTELALDGEGE